MESDGAAEEVKQPEAPVDVVDTPKPDTAHKAAPALTNLSSTPTTTQPTTSSAPEIPEEHKHSKLATPAVRRICKELNVEIHHVRGSGKDGRVLKEDVLKFVENGGNQPAAQTATPSAPAAAPVAGETTVPLSFIQAQMFKTMTRSLAIPHFLFNDAVHLDPLTTIRKHLNKQLESDKSSSVKKLSYMPFFIKAMSLALNEYPLLNSRVSTEGDKPALINRPSHNIGIAMDTPAGLIVPNIKNVQNLSILEIAAELNRLQKAGSEGKLSPADLKGGTITLSNIGNIGGRVVSPVIVDSEVAILGVGKAQTIPAFDKDMKVVPKTEVGFSWSADHRVVDGATMARMATLMKSYVEAPETMLVKLR